MQNKKLYHRGKPLGSNIVGVTLDLKNLCYKTIKII